jgi:transcriptional regulator with XRE-family HTH domain
MGETSIGQIITALRGAESKVALANRAGVHPKYLERLEAGGVPNPGVRTLQKIAAALKVPVGRLIPDPKRRKSSAA